MILWIGTLLIAVSLAGSVLLAFHHFNLSMPIAWGLSVVAFLATFGIYYWHEKQNPIVIQTRLGPGGYADNYDVSGIKWQNTFSEAQVRLSNNGNHDFSNLDVTVLAELPIWQTGIIAPFSDCKDSPAGTISSMQLVLHLHDASGKEFTALAAQPPIASKTFRIHCDVLLRKAYLEITLALVNPNTSPDKSLGMLLARRDPKWIVVHVDSQLNGEPRAFDYPKCFQGENKCPDMGESTQNH